MVEADTLDDVVDIFGKARQHKSQIAARRRPGDVARFEDRNRPAPLGNLARDREAGEPRADHADINVEIEVQPRTVGTGNRSRLVPARFHVGAFAHWLRYAM